MAPSLSSGAPAVGAQALPAAWSRGLCLPEPAVSRLCPPHSNQSPCPGPVWEGPLHSRRWGQRDKMPTSRYWHAAISTGHWDPSPTVPSHSVGRAPYNSWDEDVDTRPSLPPCPPSHPHPQRLWEAFPKRFPGTRSRPPAGTHTDPPQGCCRRAASPRERRRHPEVSRDCHAEQEAAAWGGGGVWGTLQEGAPRGGRGASDPTRRQPQTPRKPTCEKSPDSGDAALFLFITLASLTSSSCSDTRNVCK